MSRNAAILGLAFVAAALALVFPFSAGAEGPGQGGRRVRLNDERAGAYLVRAVTSPTPPRVQNLYVEIRVADAVSGDVITDATVRAIVREAGTQEVLLDVEATHDIAPIPTEYAAHLPVSAPGVYEIEIQIGGRLGAAEVRFLERVTTPSSVGAILSVGAPVAGLIILGIIFLSLQRGSSKPAG